MTVVKCPYSTSRLVYARRPRISKNGTPEERAAIAAEAEIAVMAGKARRVWRRKSHSGAKKTPSDFLKWRSRSGTPR